VGSSTSVQVDSNAGKKGTIPLPPPGTAPKPEIAGNKAPSSIPSGIKQESKDNVKVFEDEQKAIRSSESGVWDTQGFNLSEYVDLIKERIKARWFIPSNLRNSQGHTTLVFYIGRDGRYANLRIVDSSGIKSLDLAALRAVMDSNPFPALPKGFPGDHVGAKFILSYNEP
jgi:TonB family protein